MLVYGVPSLFCTATRIRTPTLCDPPLMVFSEACGSTHHPVFPLLCVLCVQRRQSKYPFFFRHCFLPFYCGNPLLTRSFCEDCAHLVSPSWACPLIPPFPPQVFFSFTLLYPVSMRNSVSRDRSVCSGDSFHECLFLNSLDSNSTFLP